MGSLVNHAKLGRLRLSIKGKLEPRTGSGRASNGIGGGGNVVPMCNWRWVRLTFASRNSHWYGRNIQNRRGRATVPGINGGMVGTMVAGVGPPLVAKGP